MIYEVHALPDLFALVFVEVTRQSVWTCARSGNREGLVWPWPWALASLNVPCLTPSHTPLNPDFLLMLPLILKDSKSRHFYSPEAIGPLPESPESRGVEHLEKFQV